MPAGVWLGMILAQAVTPASPASPDLERVRQALAAPPALTTQTHADEEGRLLACRGTSSKPGC